MNRKESAFLAQEYLEMRESGEAFLSGCRVLTRDEQSAIFLHGMSRNSCANAGKVLRNPCLSPVEDEGRVGVLLQTL